MSYECSLNLVVAESSFPGRLAGLKLYDFPHSDEQLDSIRRDDPALPFTNDLEYLVDPTPLTNFPDRFAQLRPLANDLSKRSRYETSTTLLKANFYRGKPEEGILTLSFSPWAQHPPLLDHGYLILNLAYPAEKNQDFIPFDHPSLNFILDIADILDPVYGWLVDDWSALPPDTDWLTGRPWHIPSLPIWQENYFPFIIGLSLSQAIKAEFDLDDKNNGLYICNQLSGGTHWITQPGSMDEWLEYRSKIWDKLYKGTEVGKRHQAAMTKLREALAKIPVSVLDNSSASGG